MKKNIFLFILFSTFLITPLAQAGLDITPQKIVIGSRERGSEFTILNLNNDAGTYRIDLLNFHQDENGVYKKSEAPLDPRFNPENIVRFSPRQFTIAAGGKQKVRLSLRKPADLPEGEYRFHIEAIRFAAKNEIEAGNGETIGVYMNVGVSIPVIVRHGNVSATAKIGQPTITDGTQTKNGAPELKVRIDRSGNASTIGKLDIFWTPQGGKQRQIGKISNMNIFTEIDHRNVTVPLNELPTGAGSLTLRYTDEADKDKMFDEITVQR